MPTPKRPCDIDRQALLEALARQCTGLLQSSIHLAGWSVEDPKVEVTVAEDAFGLGTVEMRARVEIVDLDLERRRMSGLDLMEQAQKDIYYEDGGDGVAKG